MYIPENYDFSGWASRNNIRCADGRTILPNAFKESDGESVSLVWNHQHTSPTDVIGHAILQNRKDGLYAFGYLNDTESGVIAKALLEHGDIVAMSICANNLVEDNSKNVAHGTVCEVSLVHKGANPGAYIETVIEHGENGGEMANIYTGAGIFMNDEYITHSDMSDEEVYESMTDEQKDLLHGLVSVALGEAESSDESDDEAEEILDGMNDEQKELVYGLVGMALAESDEDEDEDEDDEDDEDDEIDELLADLDDEQKELVYGLVGMELENEGGESEMKHNIFESNYDNYAPQEMSREDMALLLEDARKMGSLRDAINENVENGVLMHSIDATGMETPTGSSTYGFNDPSMLFPDYKSFSPTPEFISRNMGWVDKVMAKVHHSPFSRVKSVFADITEDEARAKGYMKGNLKKDEVFSLLKRTTSPQTVYKKQSMDKDDVDDITDFAVLDWIKGEMRTMLNEELARAFLIGDGRSTVSDDKIFENNIRPIANDAPLFNTKITIQTAASDGPEVLAKSVINSAIKSRKYYKGSGNPDFYTTEDMLTEMLLLEDGIGHKLYKTEAELATALRVKEIITVEPMDGAKIDSLTLLGIIVNLIDYNVGADKGGAVNLFDDFDLDYNKMKYLIETRCSGALIKPFSAITLLHKEV